MKKERLESIMAILFFSGFFLIMVSIGTIETSLTIFPSRAIIIGITGIIFLLISTLIIKSISFKKGGEK